MWTAPTCSLFRWQQITTLSHQPGIFRRRTKQPLISLWESGDRFLCSCEFSTLGWDSELRSGPKSIHKIYQCHGWRLVRFMQKQNWSLFGNKITVEGGMHHSNCILSWNWQPAATQTQTAVTQRRYSLIMHSILQIKNYSCFIIMLGLRVTVPHYASRHDVKYLIHISTLTHKDASVNGSTSCLWHL